MSKVEVSDVVNCGEVLNEEISMTGQTESDYMRRLRRHSGVPVASAVTAILFFGALGQPDSKLSAIALSLLVSSAIWSVVLLAVKMQTLSEEKVKIETE